MFACTAGLHRRLARRQRLSYACALAIGNTSSSMDNAILDIECHRPLIPFVTGWCPRCRRVEILVSLLSEFPDTSAFLAHIYAVAAQNKKRHSLI